jgi:biopolymer transport protein ExbD
MAKVSKPKSAPGIDMTPMVDLAFLLVTFFMLSANFRTDEIVPVDVPASIAENVIPNSMLVRVTVDKNGRVFYGIAGKEETKQNMLMRMSEKYKVNFTTAQVNEFVKLSDIGVGISQLPAFLDMNEHERGQIIEKSMGVPTDSTNNQLKDWIAAGRTELLAFGESEYLTARQKGFDVNVSDFKPKFVLKVDGNAEYIYAKRVVETFRDLKENNLSFITSLKADPRKTHE